MNSGADDNSDSPYRAPVHSTLKEPRSDGSKEKEPRFIIGAKEVVVLLGIVIGLIWALVRYSCS